MNGKTMKIEIEIPDDFKISGEETLQKVFESIYLNKKVKGRDGNYSFFVRFLEIEEEHDYGMIIYLYNLPKEQWCDGSIKPEYKKAS